MTSPAVKRLQQDLKQLLQEPIVGANAQPANEKNMMIWHGIVVGIEGALQGIPIRFCLEFPNDYPNSPPDAYFETYISYQNGAAMYDTKGRLEVCLNIFGNFGRIHTEWKSESSGWSPAYTVSTILLSMQALMMSDMLSTSLSETKKMIDSALKFTCDKTNHVGSDSSKWFPKIISDPAVAAAITEKYRKKNPKPAGPLETFYICYANGQLNGKNSTIGYGVNIENPRNGTLSSPCEYLSKESFVNGNVRRSSTNKPFEYWLPILIQTEDWSSRKKIKQEFLSAVYNICSVIRYNGPCHMKVFKVCSSLMNRLVVEIMQNEGNGTANDRFINGYFAIYRLLYQYSQDDKELIKLANDSLKKFNSDWKERVKNKVANLGEFLMFLTISSQVSWNDIATAFKCESDARNVFWYCEGNQSNYAAYPELVDINYKGRDRAKKVFAATVVGRNLVMFQIKFANVPNFLDFAELNSNLGLAPDMLKAELKNLYSRVVAVKNWKEFYDFIEIPYETDEKRERELVEAVQRSAAQGYHGKFNSNASGSYNNSRDRRY